MLLSPQTLVKSTALDSYFVHYGKYSSTFPPLYPRKQLRLVKSCIVSSLKAGLKHGALIIQDGNETLHFGQSNPLKSDETLLIGRITVVNKNFWARVYLSHDLGFAEAYMHGDFVASPADVKTILDLWIRNREHLSGLSSYVNHVSVVLSALYVKTFGQSLSNAKLNAMTGYDVCNDFFKSFLSKDMTYSCAVFPEKAGDARGDLTDSWREDDLYTAQIHKIHLLLERARLRPGHRLLEFGTGWGQLAIEAAKMGCTVDTLTLSIQQKILAEQRIADEGLQDKIRVHLLDYRNLPQNFQHQFDAFICVEMIEAVGVKYLPKFFEILDWALKPDRAAAVITATTQPESRFSLYQAEDYARKYQWPNSFCPSPTYLVSTVEAALHGKLIVESIEQFAGHYARTLREWAMRLQKSWGPDVIKSLIKSQPHLAEGDNLNIFKRKWEYMYVYAEIGYARGYTGLHHFTFVRPSLESHDSFPTPCN
ncbi:CFS1-like protein [Phlebopus sp. FC_14]|nr:CFS1-like protein [Phlebopus sp. FC_14]